MKLLLDQNLSYRLVKKLEGNFPGTQHVSSLGLNNKADREIWEAAKSQDYTIVTFDSDFLDFSLTQGHPPKLLWIRTGNLTTNNIERLLTSKFEQILAFQSDSEISCLEIDE